MKAFRTVHCLRRTPYLQMRLIGSNNTSGKAEGNTNNRKSGKDRHPCVLRYLPTDSINFFHPFFLGRPLRFFLYMFTTNIVLVLHFRSFFLNVRTTEHGVSFESNLLTRIELKYVFCDVIYSMDVLRHTARD